MGLGAHFSFWAWTISKRRLLNRLRDELALLLEPAVNGAGAELWELEYNARAAGGLLRIYIDRPDGITVDDCARVSHAVSAVLDERDPIPGQYTLEVSSPGLDRVLRRREHFVRFTGEPVRVETNAPIEGRKRFSGKLSQVSEHDLLLDVDGRSVTIPLTAVHKARLAPV